ncbi:helix-turn-helix transcriptional regulator [Bacillus sp. CGMCC 1.16607]|uniref:helix-turn-helix transcriptional regulator n=1 Tax=Bacillus sp. CGMCC 1.16607 TaxID=3351842 RepID=UPI003629D353
MKKMNRLFELLNYINDIKRFSTQDLVEHFSVSKRTIIRDLKILEDMGVPIYSTTGPNGGYEILQAAKVPSIPLSMEEATGVLLSYEMLELYPDSPFKKDHIPTVSKIRASLPRNLLNEVDEFKKRILLDVPHRTTKNIFLKELLLAAISKTIINIEYESKSGCTRRNIYPFGIYMSNGLWYCGCYCYKRQEHVTLRVDRIVSLEELDDNHLEKPEDQTFAEWRKMRKKCDEDKLLSLHISLTQKGCKMLDPEPHFAALIKVALDGTGEIKTKISPDDIDWYGSIMLSMHTEIHVHEPIELIDWIMNKTCNIREKYQ